MTQNKYSPQELAVVLTKSKPYLVDTEKSINEMRIARFGKLTLEFTIYNGHVVQMSNITRKEIKYEIPKDEYSKG